MASPACIRGNEGHRVAGQQWELPITSDLVTVDSSQDMAVERQTHLVRGRGEIGGPYPSAFPLGTAGGEYAIALHDHFRRPPLACGPVVLWSRAADARAQA